MGLVDRIRKYIFETYIKPAVEKGIGHIELRAGDIYKGLLLNNRVPAVCNALGSKKSIEIYNTWLNELGYNVRVEASLIGGPPSGYGPGATYRYSFVKIDKHPSETETIELQYKSFGNVNTEHNYAEKDVTEDDARRIMSHHLGVPLYKKKLNINGKYKEFDLVNISHRIVGDFKNFKFRGQASAEISNMIEYIWVMEKLEKYTGTKWRKIIVGAGNRKTFETFARRYDPWLEDVEIYFIDKNGQVYKLR